MTDLRFESTRGLVVDSLKTAIFDGLALDGGLYVPTTIPQVDRNKLSDSSTYKDVARHVLTPFWSDDCPDLETVIETACTFEPKIVDINDRLSALELFWGPTAAFKDFGARFLAAFFSAAAERTKTILVATSGDTGGAVAAAFWKLPNTRVVILYPKGRVSARQEHQLTCWGENVMAIRIDGSFDDCQTIVKQAFADQKTRFSLGLSSANSINIGRLLPQSIYYAWASLHKPGDVIIPTGNLGNALACLWAREMGFDIGRVGFASNANRPVADYISGKPYKAATTIQTIANAMDVGAPSNMERLHHQFDYPELESTVFSGAFEDDRIRSTIVQTYTDHDYLLDPHTACAVALANDVECRGLVAGTAHPAKFESIVEPLVDINIPLPPALTRIADWTTEVVDSDASLKSVMDHICDALETNETFFTGGSATDES